MEIIPLAMLLIIIGMVKGTRLGCFVSEEPWLSSSVMRPPMPEPTITPTRVTSEFVRRPGRFHATDILAAPDGKLGEAVRTARVLEVVEVGFGSKPYDMLHRNACHIPRIEGCDIPDARSGRRRGSSKIHPCCSRTGGNNANSGDDNATVGNMSKVVRLKNREGDNPQNGGGKGKSHRFAVHAWYVPSAARDDAGN